MDDRKMLRTGLAGTAIAALCCFTPILVVLFGLLGLSMWVGWLDYVLIPLLAAFSALTVWALIRRRQKRTCP